MRPPMPNFALSRRAKTALWTVGVLIVVLILLANFTGVYINWMWFGSIGHRGVYTRVFWTKFALFFVFGVSMALMLAGNMAIAYAVRPPFRPMSPEQQNIERYRVMLEPRRWWLASLVAVIALLSAGASAQGRWSTWLLFFHGTRFGVGDPQFGKDISFYAWDYPAYRTLLGFGFVAIILALILSALVHYLTGAIRLQTRGPKMTIAARRHITVLVFVFIVLKAIAYWLDRYGLVFSSRSKFTGASYTDVHAVLTSRTILFWISLVIAAAVLASMWLRSTLIPVIGFVSMLILSIVISGIYPAILQHFSVNPNASSKEVPYINRNIDATRAAYGIQTGTDVDYVDYRASSTPNPAVLAATDSATLNNIRILDPNVISPTIAKFQQGGSNVYDFAPKLDVDRYTVDGVEHDYIVGVRELDAANLSGTQANWINEHTNYTHGYGFVAAAADDDITTDGNQPGAFAAGGIPPTGTLIAADPLAHPQVYYGELMPDYSIVGAEGRGPQEFDANDRKITYTGGGGVSLASFLTRLAFAVNYKQGNFVLNSSASAKGARLIFNRDPRQVVQKVAPFLKVDGDPYPFLDTQTGDITWMVDGYTTIDNYPYSERESLSSLTDDSLAEANVTAQQPNDSINYIRNSVKATVDAYTGKVTLYDVDSTDPVLNSWMKIFPGLVKTTMPQAVKAHIRYPEDLFDVQRSMLQLYHEYDRDTAVQFYNVGQKWTVPSDPTGAPGSQSPYYVLASPAAEPDSTSSQFQLTSPMNVNTSTYLAAYLSVDSDPGPDYGKLTVLKLPQGTSAVQGPEQVFNKISANATITRDLSYFNVAGGGSHVIHGNLLTLPYGNSFLYVEPLYTQSSVEGGGTYPTLQRVIAVYGDKIGYGDNLSGALYDLVHNLPTGSSAQDLNGGTGVETQPPSTSSSSPSSSSSSAPSSSSSSPPSSSAPPVTVVPGAPTKQQLSDALAAYQTALRGGNVVAQAKAQQHLDDLLQQYLNATGHLPSSSGKTPASPTPTPSSSPGG